MTTIRADLVATLRRVPLFAELSEGELGEVAQRVTRKEYLSGATIFTDGERCRELLVVATGAVRLMKTAPSGREQLISIERMGSTLAEVPVFEDGQYSFTARATISEGSAPITQK
jgi:CRP-like cAMP-binding protein